MERDPSGWDPTGWDWGGVKYVDNFLMATRQVAYTICRHPVQERAQIPALVCEGEDAIPRALERASLLAAPPVWRQKLESTAHRILPTACHPHTAYLLLLRIPTPLTSLIFC